MNLEKLSGKECMIIAGWSAFAKDPTLETFTLRLQQIEKAATSPINPQMEADNFRDILQSLRINAKVTVSVAKSINELTQICEQHDHVFVGFEKGQNNGQKKHFAHLGNRIQNGFRSDQQFTSDDALVAQIMEQGGLTIFVASQSV